MEKYGLRKYRISIEEGAFSKGYGPGFQQGRGLSGGGGVSIGFLLWLAQRTKKRKAKKPSILYLLKLLRFTDLLDVLDGASISMD